MRNVFHFLTGLVLGVVLFAALAAHAAPYLPAVGGTGTSTVPTYGKILLGNSSGTYSVVATSSLGIAATTPGGSNTYVQFNDGGVFNGTSGLTFNKTLSELDLSGALYGASTHVSNTYSTTVRGDGVNNFIILGTSSASPKHIYLGDGNTTNGFYADLDTSLLTVFSRTFKFPDWSGNFLVGSTTSLFVTDAGNVGVGTSSPYKKLSVGGDLLVGAPTAGGTLGDLFLPKLATPAGTFLAADGSGKVIATTTPTPGGSGTVTSITAGSGLLGGTITTTGTITNTLATSSVPAVPDLPYFTSTGSSGTATLGHVATSSFGVSSPLSYSGTLGAMVGGSGGSLSLGTVPIANGGTATTTGGFTGGVDYFDGSKKTNGSLFRFDGTNLGVGTTTPGTLLSVGNTQGVNFTTATTTFNTTAGVRAPDFCTASKCLSSAASGGGNTVTLYATTSTGALVTYFQLPPISVVAGDKILVGANSYRLPGSGCNAGDVVGGHIEWKQSTYTASTSLPIMRNSAGSSQDCSTSFSFPLYFANGSTQPSATTTETVTISYTTLGINELGSLWAQLIH